MAMKSDNRDQWIRAADEELSNIEGHDVWDDQWEEPAAFLKTVWTFKTKPKTLSAAEKKKARLCIQGFSQIPGLDYDNTFAPTGKYTSLLIVLMLAIDRKLPIQQFDVKSAFLFAPLKETLYIKTPEGCKRKAPYLKLKKSTLRTQTSTCQLHSVIFFHVDDLVVVGKVDEFEKQFLIKFPNSAAHDPDTLLGMELLMDNNQIKLSQEKLIKKGLELAGIRESPAVSILSSFNHAPGIQHWKQVLHCWKYLAGTINLHLTLRPNLMDNSQALQHFTDATWADDLETRLSRSGSICFWKACPIAWNSKKQRNITMSSTKAELNALSDGVQENQWIKFLVEELWNENLKPTQFHIDNQGLLKKLKNFGSNSKTKHIGIKMKKLRDMKKNEEITVTLIPSDEMIADALTKPSNFESLCRLQEKCFLVQAHYSSSCGGC
ncbi:hypothetical protein VP01_3962g1 [Puccinia sorghi]|uniref:Reverse transcriptase Ty1/copia-type domain-containing protein n=1 Tax=Puccinia sorghi TaxID=27349 RepID=A0A0L6UUA0_9BASI|nr:hypothetical protein VP01_3962g1 [Puccinia sorghi]